MNDPQILGLAAWLAATSIPAAMGSEAPGAWLTVPATFAAHGEGKLWSTRTIPLDELSGGVTPVDEPVTQGRHAGRWANHPRYPTIHTTAVPQDWTGADSVAVDIHSGKATGQQVTLAVLADSPATPYRDWWLHTFTIDWTGWRTVAVPRSGFEKLGEPAGWAEVGGVYFFTKIFGRQPHPETVLVLDDLRLGNGAAGEASAPQPPPEAPARLPVVTQLAPLDLQRLNHGGPELRTPGPVTAPIQYGSYFLAERALFGYDPRFLPGTVSFAPDGTPYLVAGGATVQSLGADGQWTLRDLGREVIEPYARQQLGFEALKLCDSGQDNETTLRFDDDGDAYLLAFIEDPTGDWRTRTGLLLHSRDGLRTWTVHKLPYYLARFEKLVGHNADALRRPPVILLSRYFSPTDTFLLLPEKQADGSLKLPPAIPIASDAIAWLPHSGEANQALSHGDRVYLVYGRLTILDGRTKEDGAPSFAVVYDRRTGTLSEPVLLGFGGRNAEDDHNWPSLAAGPDGHLHVVINGHHDPFVYTRSTRPWDISEWTPPVKEAAGLSYAGLVCDAAGTLYSVTRCSDPGYYFRLTLHRKKAGQDWEPPRHLVVPFKPYYKVWFHKLSLAPDGRLFLTYHAQSPRICVYRDEYEAYIDIWPDREAAFQQGEEAPRLPMGTYRDEPSNYAFYEPPASETCILMSDDGGETWRLATSAEFAR